MQVSMQDWEKGIFEVVLEKISTSKKRRGLGLLVVSERGEDIYETPLYSLSPFSLWHVCYWQEIMKQREQRKAIHEGHHRSSGERVCGEFCTSILDVIESMLHVQVYYQEFATRVVLYEECLESEFSLTLGVTEHEIEGLKPYYDSTPQRTRPKFELIQGGLPS